MPFDMIGFAEATPGTGLVNVAAAINDTLYKYDGDDIILKKEATHLLGAFFSAVSTPDNYRFRQPSLMTDHQLIKGMLEADVNPIWGYTHLFGRPLPLVGGEKLNALSQNATDETTLIGAIVGNSSISQNMLDSVRPTHSIIGDGDTTVTANTWSPCAMTWDQDLPKGDYAIVGMKFGYYIASGPLAALARIVIPGNTDWRPGVPGALMGAAHSKFYDAGYLPCWHWPLMNKVVFPHTSTPNIEVLSNAALTDQTVELLLQKVR
jgi:hypothetical protein